MAYTTFFFFFFKIGSPVCKPGQADLKLGGRRLKCKMYVERAEIRLSGPGVDKTNATETASPSMGAL